MPFLDILVHAPSYENWGEQVAYAARFATLQQAHLTGIYIRTPLTYLLPADAGASVMEILQAEAQRDLDAATQAKPAFIEYVKGLGVRSADWISVEGDVAKVLTLAATWHDLLVLGAEGPNGSDSLGTTEQTLIESAAPCLVVPANSSQAELVLDRIAVAWNGSIEAMRAIHAALPVLMKAQQVVLLVGRQRESYSAIGSSPVFDLDAYLQRHRIAYERCSIDAADRDVSHALLDAAAEARADLLVMGAYGRARFTEWVLGGTTRHALRSSRIPLFMRH